MAASIVLTGLAANDPVPGNYIEVNFAQGESTGSGSVLKILLMANKTSSGSATTNTVIYSPNSTVPCQTNSDVISLFGDGSEMHRGYRRIAPVNKDTEIHFLAVTASGGTAASGTIVLVNAATGNGNLRIWVGDEFVDVGIVSGDSLATIGAAAIAAINAMTHWPVTAAFNTDTITLTAKIAGPRGNYIKYQTAITSGIATTATGGSLTALSSGATADSNTTALSTILSRYYYYIVSAAEDATQFGALNTQVLAQAAPTTGIRQRCFAGSVDTIGNITTLATGINSTRAEVVWQPSSDITPFELACAAVAAYALFEGERLPKPRHNFSGFGNDPVTQPFWQVKAPRSGTGPSRANIKSALNNGITAIAANSNGTSYITKRVTTRSLSGSTADYRARDAHKISVCDFFANDLMAKTALQFSGKDLADDVPQGTRPPGADVVTPLRYKAAIFRLINDYDENDQLKNVPAIMAGTIVQRETSPTTRLSARIPLQPIDILDQVAVALDQVG